MESATYDSTAPNFTQPANLSTNFADYDFEFEVKLFRYNLNGKLVGLYDLTCKMI